MGAIGPTVVLVMAPFAAAMILLAAWIWRAAARRAPVAGTTRTPPPAPGTPPVLLSNTSGS
jgi:hypothetical protein